MSTALEPGNQVESCQIRERLPGSFNAMTYIADFYPDKAAKRLRLELQQCKEQEQQILLRQRLKFITRMGKDKITVFLKQYNDPGYRDPLLWEYVPYQQKLHAIINGCAGDCLCRELDSFICKEKGMRGYFQALDFFEKNQPLTDILEGRSGSILSRNDTLPFEEMLFHAKKMLYAISILHENKIVHGDLKPDNLLLLPNEGCAYRTTLRVIDFDASLMLGVPHPRKVLFKKENPEATYRYRGTKGYLSPEHFEGEDPCPASDIFTASVIALEMLSKSGHPFPFSDEGKYREAVRKGEFLFSGTKGPLSSTAIEALKAGLSYRKENRPSALDLLEALKS